MTNLVYTGPDKEKYLKTTKTFIDNLSDENPDLSGNLVLVDTFTLGTKIFVSESLPSEKSMGTIYHDGLTLIEGLNCVETYNRDIIFKLDDKLVSIDQETWPLIFVEGQAKLPKSICGYGVYDMAPAPEIYSDMHNDEPITEYYDNPVTDTLDIWFLKYHEYDNIPYFQLIREAQL